MSNHKRMAEKLLAEGARRGFTGAQILFWWNCADWTNRASRRAEYVREKMLECEGKRECGIIAAILRQIIEKGK